MKHYASKTSRQRLTPRQLAALRGGRGLTVRTGEATNEGVPIGG